jgi:hypothetical protein
MPSNNNKLAFDWLKNNPQKWVGKKIRDRKSDQTYIVRDVLHNGSVVLEKKWVLLPSNVKVVRQDFEADSP